MLWILVIAFFILWILGLASVYTSVALTWLFFALWIVVLITQVAIARRHRTSIQPRV
jgi:hypothetical protein